MNFLKNVWSQLKNNSGDHSSTSNFEPETPSSIYEGRTDSVNVNLTDLFTSQPLDQLKDALDYIANDLENEDKKFMDMTLDEVEFATVHNMTSDDSQPLEESQHLGQSMETDTPQAIIDFDKLFVSMGGKDDHKESASLSSNNPDTTSNDIINNSSGFNHDSEVKNVSESYSTKDEKVTNSEIEDISTSQNSFHGFVDVDFEDEIKRFAISIYTQHAAEFSKQEITGGAVISNEIPKGTQVIAELNKPNTNYVETSTLQDARSDEDRIKIDLNQNIIKNEETKSSDSSEMKDSALEDCKTQREEKSLVTISSASAHFSNESDSDSCTGYHSSDFEFISESEAEADGLYVLYERRYKTKAQTEEKTLPSTCDPNDPIPSTSSDNTAQSTGEGCAMQRDYRSIRRQFLTEEAERLRQNHVIPEGQNYFDLFDGPNAAIANDLYILENKSIRAQTCMNAQYEGLGFDMRLMNREEHVMDEDKREAEACAKRIADMYPLLNRKRRRRM